MLASKLQQHHGDATGAGGVRAPRIVPRIRVMVAFAHVKLVSQGVLQAGVTRLSRQVVPPDSPPGAEPLELRPRGVPDVVALLLLGGKLVCVEPVGVGVAAAKKIGRASCRERVLFLV